MQRPQRRLMLPNDSDSLAPNVSLKVRRRRSRTSSGGGDFLNRESKESQCKAKVKSRRKANARVVSNVRAKKKIKIPKNQKPNIKSLQKAIVLAPFHTLKKCFQTRLINLYSYEKMKKIKHKMKMAKKPNTAFEYDVIEVKPSIKKKIKKEPSTSKTQQKSKEKIVRSQESRSQSYCQCNREKSKTEVKSPKCNHNDPKPRKRRTRSNITKDPTSPEYLFPPCFANHDQKRRKVSNDPFNATTLKTELCIPTVLKSGQDCFVPGRSDFSISVVSSPSKADSWETYSNSPLSKEGYLQGSLAISTTSFDSFVERFEKGRLECNDHIASKTLLLKKNSKPKNKASTSVIISPNDLLPRIRNSESRHLIMAGIKPSEEGIADFMDREPQAQAIASIETAQHLHPLRRQSKIKEKPQPEPEPSRAYALRSTAQSQHEMPVTETRSRSEHCRLSQSSQRSAKTARLSKMSSEASTQIDERCSREKRETNPPPKVTPGGSAKCRDKTPTLLENNSSDQICVEYEEVELKEVPSKRQNTNSEHKLEVPDKTTSDAQEQEIKDNENTTQSEDGFWVEEIVEPNPLPEEQSEISSVDILPILENGNSNGELRDDKAPQEKDSYFIFGERNSAARMGESCEFSFGLNWGLSDDEDSDSGHRFF